MSDSVKKYMRQVFKYTLTSPKQSDLIAYLYEEYYTNKPVSEKRNLVSLVSEEEFEELVDLKILDLDRENKIYNLSEKWYEYLSKPETFLSVMRSVS